MNAWMAVGERFLRVTYREEIERLVVISAVFKRRPLPESDPDADAPYIQVREADVGDVDADRHIVGLEILDAASA